MIWTKVLKNVSGIFKRNKKRCIAYLCIALVVAFALSIFFSSGYPNGDDVGYHASSVAGVANHSFFDILTSKINGCIANDLGYGEGIFYPPFTHIVAALIYKVVRVFGFDVFFALKISYFLILSCAGVFMYEFVRLITRHEKAALFSSFFYVTFPYILSDVVVRGAMAESAIFMFMPLVLMGLYYMLKDAYGKFLICFVIGCVGMIHSHLVLTMFFAIVCVLGFLPKIKLFLRKKRIIYIFAGCLVTILLSLPFLLPMLQNKMNTNYYVFEPGFMSSLETVQGWRLPLGTLFSFDRPMKTVIGFVGVFGLCIIMYSVVRYKKIRTNDNSVFFLFAIISSILCIFCSTVLFSWAKLPSVFLMIQFPWRLCSFAAFSTAILLGCSIPYLERGMGSGRDLLYIAIGAVCCFSVFRINNFAKTPQVFSQDYLMNVVVFDYLPTATPDSSDYVNAHTRMPISDTEDVIISDVYSNTPDISFDVAGVSGGDIKIVLPRLYYLGYHIEAVYNNGEVEELEYNMSEDGFIEFDLDRNANIVVTYPGTRLQRVSFSIAGVVFVGFLVGLLYIRKRDGNKEVNIRGR